MYDENNGEQKNAGVGIVRPSVRSSELRFGLISAQNSRFASFRSIYRSNVNIYCSCCCCCFFLSSVVLFGIALTHIHTQKKFRITWKLIKFLNTWKLWGSLRYRRCEQNLLLLERLEIEIWPKRKRRLFERQAKTAIATNFAMTSPITWHTFWCR